MWKRDGVCVCDVERERVCFCLSVCAVSPKMSNVENRVCECTHSDNNQNIILKPILKYENFIGIQKSKRLNKREGGKEKERKKGYLKKC